LVDDLLEVSRIEQGRISLELTPLDLTVVTREVVEQLQPTATAKQLPLNFQAESAALPVVADVDRVKQVLLNVIGNAIKYTPRGQVDVTVRRDEDAETWGVVRVKDTGVGVSAADQARLFTKFFRAKTDATQKISGTGLGLWITKRLVELMRGKLYLESMEGTGTQVTVMLPVLKPAANAPTEKDTGRKAT
jgi:signal transduction histidine kinase